MKVLLGLLLLLGLGDAGAQTLVPFQPAFVGFAYQATTIDGDTIKVNLSVWPNVAMTDERIRLIKIDTPEMHAKTQCERDLAAKATAYTQARLASAKQPVQVHVYQRGPLRDGFGRALGEVFVDGVSLNDELLAKGIARPYGGPKVPWC